MKIKLFLVAAMSSSLLVTAQVKIGNNSTTINSNSVLEMESTNQGMLLPRVALTSTSAFAPLTAHIAGMSVYNTATADTGATAVTPGYYYNDGSKWVKLAAEVPSAYWSLAGNAGINSGSNFLGTTDNSSLKFKTNNIERVVLDSLGGINLKPTPNPVGFVRTIELGDTTLIRSSVLRQNVALGDSANQLMGNGYGNVALGSKAMALTLGSVYNTVIGQYAFYEGTGSRNVAVGDRTLTKTSGSGSVAIGTQVLRNATTGQNTAMGYFSQNSLTTGSGNTSIGVSTLGNLTTGSENTAIGNTTLTVLSADATGNTAIGSMAGRFTSFGNYNVIIGESAGFNNQGGSYNTFIGAKSDHSTPSLSENSNVTTIGYRSRSNISNAIILGSNNPAFLSNVGIGNAAPTNKLHITANANPLRMEGVQEYANNAAAIAAGLAVGVVYRTGELLKIVF